MLIRDRLIGPDQPPYVIAEVSCNHAGSEAVAMALIQMAKDAGAEAVKFQFYTPEGMVGEPFRDEDVTVQHVITGGPWDGQGMYELYDKAQMPWEWGPRLKQRCHDLGLAFIASAYDTDGLDWLMANCVPDALKVASFEATDTPFVYQMSRAGPPVIISLGMTSEHVMENAVAAALPSTTFLYCVSAYPTLPMQVGLGNLSKWVNTFGFSDHTIGHAVACAAVAKGACVLEKHIQLHPALTTADSHFSATPEEFTAYCANVKAAWEACQPVVGDPEKDSRQFRRAPGGKRGSYVG